MLHNIKNNSLQTPYKLFSDGDGFLNWKLIFVLFLLLLKQVKQRPLQWIYYKLKTSQWISTTLWTFQIPWRTILLVYAPLVHYLVRKDKGLTPTASAFRARSPIPLPLPKTIIPPFSIFLKHILKTEKILHPIFPWVLIWPLTQGI